MESDMRLAATIIVDLDRADRLPLGTPVKFYMSNGEIRAKTDAGELGTVKDDSCKELLRSEKNKKCVVIGSGITTANVGVYVPFTSKALKKALFGTNGVLTISGDTIAFQPLDGTEEITKRLYGVRASIASGEELQSRVTLSRMLLVGAFAFALKKSSGGEKFVAIEGDDFCWAVEIRGDQANEAMSFVAEINDIAKKGPKKPFMRIDGLAERDGALHVVAIALDIDRSMGNGDVDARATSASDGFMARMQECGYEVSGAQVASVDGHMRLFVTYR